MNTETQNLIAKSTNRLLGMIRQGGPEFLIQSELENLAELWNVDVECVMHLLISLHSLWNITGEVGEA